MMYIGAQSGIVKRLIAKWAKSVTLSYYLRCMSGDPGKSLQYQLARSLILGKIKEAIGFDRIKMLVVGAAPADIETKKYFCSLDMPLVDLYGMTECTIAHCMSRPDYPNMASVGPSLPGMCGCCQVSKIKLQPKFMGIITPSLKFNFTA